MKIDQRSIRIGDHSYDIKGDHGYMQSLGESFEPATLDMLSSMVSADSRVIDIGANIGFTAIAFSQFCPQGKIVAIEPVSRTFDLLTKNVENSKSNNISTHRFALGSSSGEVLMQGNPDYLAGSFVADKFSIDDSNHFSDHVELKTLDDEFAFLGLDRIDAIKIDVEGYELDAFYGARNVLAKHQPLVFLEMNHWCLNMFRRISIPEFRDRLMSIFPVIYAIHGTEFLNFRDDTTSYRIGYEHLNMGRFNNLIAGFDEKRVLSSLHSYEEKRSKVIALADGGESISAENRLNDATQKLRVVEFRCAKLEETISEKDEKIWQLESAIESMKSK